MTAEREPEFDAAAAEGVATRVRALLGDVAAAAVAAGCDAGSVRVCGVSKRHPRAAVDAAVAAGLRDVGESYAQEAHDKLAGFDGAVRHYVGHVQTNKAKMIALDFDVVQTLDRRDAATALAKAGAATGRRIRVLVQVNVSPTERHGIAPGEAEALAAYARSLDLHVDGVMAIAPNTNDRNQILRSFEEAARLFSHIGGSTLSIGMSGDWREAVACGSTMVRIGTAIFGSRLPVP